MLMVCRAFAYHHIRAYQVSSTGINPAPNNASKGHQSPSQLQARPRLSAQSPLFTMELPEPYVSVGCLKCGAPDHVATNRNCPRPRKSTPAAYTIPPQTQATKKSIAKSPTKKPAVDNHHLKEAKVGDDTKFWYYISDDSEEGEQGDTKAGKRVCVEMSQNQDPTATRGEYHDSMGDGFRMALDPIDESTQLDLSSRHVANRGSRKLGRDKVTKPSQDNDKVFRTITYGPPVRGSGSSGPTTPQRPQGELVDAEIKRDSRSICSGNGLGSVPSLPWKVTNTSPLPPVKHPAPSPRSDVKTTKTPRQRKIFPKLPAVEERGEPKGLDPPLQKLPHKGLTLSPVKVAINRSQQNMSSIIEATPCQPASVQTSPIEYSRYPAATPRHTNHTFAQSIEESFLAEKAEITRFKYNYMGARNTVQHPRVRYTPNRVQGWRECRSMGTGLE